MGEIKLFQICHEGDLTVEVSNAIRRLGGEPNFDQSWQVAMPPDRHAAPLTRYLRTHIGGDANLLVACASFSRSRDFLLIRHSLTPGADYRELHDAIHRLGNVLELPFETTFIVQSSNFTDVRTLGEHLGELCPDDSLMVTGISHDWAFCSAGRSAMFVPQESMEQGTRYRTF